MGEYRASIRCNISCPISPFPFRAYVLLTPPTISVRLFDRVGIYGITIESKFSISVLINKTDGWMSRIQILKKQNYNSKKDLKNWRLILKSSSIYAPLRIKINIQQFQLKFFANYQCKNSIFKFLTFPIEFFALFHTVWWEKFRKI